KHHAPSDPAGLRATLGQPQRWLVFGIARDDAGQSGRRAVPSRDRVLPYGGIVITTALREHGHTTDQQEQQRDDRDQLRRLVRHDQSFRKREQERPVLPALRFGVEPAPQLIDRDLEPPPHGARRDALRTRDVGQRYVLAEVQQ